MDINELLNSMNRLNEKVNSSVFSSSLSLQLQELSKKNNLGLSAQTMAAFIPMSEILKSSQINGFLESQKKNDEKSFSIQLVFFYFTTNFSFKDSRFNSYFYWLIPNRFKHEKMVNVDSNERKKDIGKDVDSTKHFWLCKIPRNEKTTKWIESAVFHLGVRIIWLNDWNQTEIVMENLLGL